jgi:hypothetical protein
MRRIILLAITLALPTTAFADPPLAGRIWANHGESLESGWNFGATIDDPHLDENCADRWRMMDMEGNILSDQEIHAGDGGGSLNATMSGVNLPEGTNQVQFQTHCEGKGWSEGTTTFDLPKD